jgi:UDP-N-acetylglucosamine:LPS N-acetylglucosamine transferase
MRRTNKWRTDRIDVLLVCSSGGHLLQLVSLARAWDGLSRIWVSFEKSDVTSLLAEEELVVAYGPTNRSIRNLMRNLWLAQRTVRRLRPRTVVTTGAGVAVPFAWLGRLGGAKVVYVESFTRIDSISLSCRLIKPVADRVYVQWPEAVPLVPGARYVGNVFSDAA